MVIKLTCGDGVVLRLEANYFEKKIFNNPDISAARSYTLRCRARSEIVNAVLDVADGESEKVTITKDNFEELQKLCEELGFRGLDKELSAFRGEIGSDLVDLKEFLKLKEHVTRKHKRVTEIERQLSEVFSWKQKMECFSHEFHCLARKVEEVARVCEERNAKALRECAKQRDLDELLSWKRTMESETPESVSSRLQLLDSKIEEVARVCEERNAKALRECAKQRDLDELLSWKRTMEQALRGCAKQCNLDQLVRDVALLKRTAIQMQITEFVYDSSKPLGGIIAHLTSECGGNVDDKQVVNVRASSVVNVPYLARNVADLGTDSLFISSRVPDSWISYDFRTSRVIPKSYSMIAYGRRCPRVGPTSWVIEVSNNGSSWTEIDRRFDSGGLILPWGVPPATVNFKISRVPSEGFRFFRLRQTGKNSDGNDSLVLCSLEIFGTLFER